LLNSYPRVAKGTFSFHIYRSHHGAFLGKTFPQGSPWRIEAGGGSVQQKVPRQTVATGYVRRSNDSSLPTKMPRSALQYTPWVANLYKPSDNDRTATYKSSSARYATQREPSFTASCSLPLLFLLSTSTDAKSPPLTENLPLCRLTATRRLRQKPAFQRILRLVSLDLSPFRPNAKSDKSVGWCRRHRFCRHGPCTKSVWRLKNQPRSGATRLLSESVRGMTRVLSMLQETADPAQFRP
jgi:hypothetical protein